jgi:charged multivesicular body protein 5
MEGRGGDLEKKVQKLDVQLNGYKQQLAKARTAGAKNLLKQKAMRVLKQKRMYEKQLEQLQNQQFNIDQTRLTQQNMQDSIAMVRS